jgi:hypothetical protein
MSPVHHMQVPVFDRGQTYGHQLQKCRIGPGERLQPWMRPCRRRLLSTTPVGEFEYSHTADFMLTVEEQRAYPRASRSPIIMPLRIPCSSWPSMTKSLIPQRGAPGRRGCRCLGIGSWHLFPCITPMKSESVSHMMS